MKAFFLLLEQWGCKWAPKCFRLRLNWTIFIWEWQQMTLIFILFHLHLDKGLLQKQKTKKLQWTKNNCVHAHLGQVMNSKIQKGQTLTAISEVLRAKVKYLSMIPAHSSTKRVARPPKPPLWPDRGSALTLTPLEGPACPTQRWSKGTCYLFSLLHA